MQVQTCLQYSAWANANAHTITHVRTISCKHSFNNYTQIYSWNKGCIGEKWDKFQHAFTNKQTCTITQTNKYMQHLPTYKHARRTLTTYIHQHSSTNMHAFECMYTLTSICALIIMTKICLNNIHEKLL